MSAAGCLINASHRCCSSSHQYPTLYCRTNIRQPCQCIASCWTWSHKAMQRLSLTVQPHRCDSSCIKKGSCMQLSFTANWEHGRFKQHLWKAFTDVPGCKCLNNAIRKHGFSCEGSSAVLPDGTVEVSAAGYMIESFPRLLLKAAASTTLSAAPPLLDSLPAEKACNCHDIDICKLVSKLRLLLVRHHHAQQCLLANTDCLWGPRWHQ